MKLNIKAATARLKETAGVEALDLNWPGEKTVKNDTLILSNIFANPAGSSQKHIKQATGRRPVATPGISMALLFSFNPNMYANDSGEGWLTARHGKNTIKVEEQDDGNLVITLVK